MSAIIIEHPTCGTVKADPRTRKVYIMDHWENAQDLVTDGLATDVCYGPGTYNHVDLILACDCLPDGPLCQLCEQLHGEQVHQ